ncbi:unnamed protein product [Chrysoparadoxa australica]
MWKPLIGVAALYARGVAGFMTAPGAGLASTKLPMFGGGGGQGQRVVEVLRNPKWPDEYPFGPQDFRRQDESNDAQFYDQPRLVYHIDDGAVNALTNYYARAFPKGADVLDICSSWVSHFPDANAWTPGKRVGLGMNESELKKNPALDSYNVQDLNVNSKLPYDDESFDVVTCVVSIDYLTEPLEVMKEAARVLRPGGKAIISFSNRCFPTKAVSIWLNSGDVEHALIIGSFFHFTGLFNKPEAKDINPTGWGDPMYVVEATKK